MLSATHISVAYGQRPILRDVSLQVRPGELCALLGGNGAGKSTLLHVLSGDRRMTTSGGTVRIDGIDVALIPPRRLAKQRAMLCQSARTDFTFTVEEVVTMGRYPYDDRSRDRAIIMEAMKMVGVHHLQRREVQTLSGGELAKVQFARALVQIWPPSDPVDHRARYLLLDEPTAALDIAQQHHLLQLVRHLVNVWNIGAVAILHDLNLASRYADTLVMLAKGEIVAEGSPWETLTPGNVRACFAFETIRVEDTECHRAYVMPE